MGTIGEIAKKKFGNTLLFPLWSFLYPEEARILKYNKKYKNLHKGKRCFILGNGPSLKDQNLEALGKEIVFSVNQFYRSSDAFSVKSNYHFWADDTFFINDKEEPCKEIIECMTDIYKCNKEIVSFFPLKHKGFVEKHEIDKEMEVSYFYSPLLIEEHMNAAVDFSRFSFNFGTVVQWCISMAIYMGFSEIYLLGCDNTQIMTIMKSALKINDRDDYGYNYSIAEKKRMEEMVSNKSLEDFFATYLNCLSEYRLLFEYCKKRGIKLVNCTSSTLIDSIPRDSFNNIIQRRDRGL